MRKRLWLIAASAIFALGLILVWSVDRRLRQHEAWRSSFPEAEWKLVRAEEGVIDPSEGTVRVTVQALDRSQTLDDIVIQNRITIVATKGPVVFMWPTWNDFVGTSCEILDLDGDGFKEFILTFRGNMARVVTYRGGRFLFREGWYDGTDELQSVKDKIEWTDIDADGHPEFVVWEMTGPAIDDFTVKEPKVERRVKRWNRALGFRDVTGQVPSRSEK